MNWDWNNLIEEESKESYFQQLKAFVKEERKTKIIYPASKHVFSAFAYTPFDSVKVVIIGQDPYIGQDQAHGLSFSCLDESVPPSLKNIFKEIDSNYFEGHGIFRGGNLIEWAQQGILMLNTVLTVEKENQDHILTEGGNYSHKKLFQNFVVRKNWYGCYGERKQGQ